MTARHHTHFGDTELPQEQKQALRKARRLQRIGLVYMVSAIAVVYVVMGSSQAMKVAWIEDLLSLVPILSFLIASRVTARASDETHPYGYHRAVAVGHLVASVALLAMGLFLVYDSASGLLRQEHPPIGTMQLFGHAVWAGWIMIAAMVYTGIGPVILGRLKLPLAETLHDKVLHADADMNKADWMTAAGAILGILGIGLGFWWADATAALLIAGSIVRDGLGNLGHATAGLMDSRARTVDDSEPHPLVEEVEELVRETVWVADIAVRVRDLGHLFHVEALVVPRHGQVDLAQLSELDERIQELDWKVSDVVVAPVASTEHTHSWARSS